MQEIPFLPAGDNSIRYPLKRFLPYFHVGVISSWLRQHAEAGGNVLDPLGSNPLYALEAADDGFRIFQAQKNPVLQLMTEVLAQCFSESEYQKAVNLLLEQEWHGQKLGRYIHDLYLTDCRNCGRSVAADGFVWKKDASDPISVVYLCPHCGESGTFPTVEADLHRLEQVGNAAIYHSRAMQRCMIEGVDNRKNIEYALACYTPRALHVVVILFNTLDQLMVSQQERSIISAVLLEVFDQASSLWYWPSREFRPQQLSVPSVYFEKNISLSIQQALRTWMDYRKPCEVVTYPVIPDQPRSICIFERKITSPLFAKQTDPNGFPTFCIFPRPNQAFWVLSAMWSAWLLGKKAAEGMLSALARQRYGWYWFAQAISTTFGAIRNKIAKKDTIFGICSDFTPSYLLAVMLGANDAGFQLTGCAFQSNRNILQMTWRNSLQAEGPQPEPPIQPARDYLTQYLCERAEPATFQELFTVCCTAPAIHHEFLPSLEGESSEYFTKVLNDLQNELANTNVYRSFAGPNISSSRWMIVRTAKDIQPLDDRIEQAIVSTVQQNPSINFQMLYNELCQAFPGFQTPDRDFCRNCLESYATRAKTGQAIFMRDADEDARKRESELDEIKELICQIGRKIGVAVHTNDGIHWMDAADKTLYTFYLSPTAIFSKYTQKENDGAHGTPVIVFPASRSRLIQLKIERNPYLKETLSHGYHLVKYRHIRKISEQEQLTLQAWQDVLDVDPPLWDPPTQLKFL